MRIVAYENVSCFGTRQDIRYRGNSGFLLYGGSILKRGSAMKKAWAGVRLVLAMIASMMISKVVAAQVVIVPGSANPFLAGQPAGTSCCSGDSTFGQSSVFAAAVSGGQSIMFGTSGGIHHYNGQLAATADGMSDASGYTGPFSMVADVGTGIAGAQGINFDGLVGVFLGATFPSGPAPTALDFSAGLDFATLAPGLNQIFWIGDGRTGIGSGSLQRFFVPDGATRLYLGTADGVEWSNNTGLIKVLLDIAEAVPEPNTWAMIIVGFGVMGCSLRRQRRMAAARLHVA